MTSQAKKQLPPIGSIIHVLISYDVSSYRVIGHIDKSQIRVVLAQDRNPHPPEHIVGRWFEQVKDIPKYLNNGAC